jgi:hypothetical protein
MEATGMILSILGATLMSLSTKENIKPLLYAYLSFFFSNIFLVYVSAAHGLIALLMQMILFSMITLKGIFVFSGKTVTYLLGSVLLVSVLLTFNSVDMTSIDIVDLWKIDTIYSVIAFAGTYLLANKNNNIREYAFVLFLIADIGFVFLAVEHSMFYFAIQSIYFLFTSALAIKNTKGRLYTFVLGVFIGKLNPSRRTTVSCSKCFK